MDNVITHLQVQQLDKRDINIVTMLSNGLRPIDMGTKVGISHRTIEARLDRLRDSLGCKTREHLVATFIRNKIIE